jgi:hypothetical protein
MKISHRVHPHQTLQPRLPQSTTGAAHFLAIPVRTRGARFTARRDPVRQLSHPGPGVYLVDMDSHGGAATFLTMTGYEQVRGVAAAIASDTESAAPAPAAAEPAPVMLGRLPIGPSGRS